MAIALVHDIPILWLDTQAADERALIEATEPDLLITCGFSIILKPPVLALPRLGCVNIHSSLLPKHRGPNPFAHAILDGDTESGVTFHITKSAIDSGDILDQTAFPLDATDTAASVYAKSCAIARERIIPVLDAIDKDGLVGTPQAEEEATYDTRLKREDFRLDWSRPAVELHRLHRACMPVEKTYFTHRGAEIRVLRATYGEAAEPSSEKKAPPGTVLQNRPGVTVATGSGTFTILAGLGGRPVPLLWPAPWNRPKPGEVLE